MLRLFYLGMVGVSIGFVVASGLVALMIALRVLPRLAGVTHTGAQIKIYEMCMILGIVAGNIMTLFNVCIPMGTWAAGGYGFFSGMFLGGWILALSETINIFPIMMRRLKLRQGVGPMIIALAVGKIFWSLLFFANHWGM